MILNIHSHHISSDSIYNLEITSTEEIPTCYYSVGLHPWETATFELTDEQLISRLEDHLANTTCIAIGECGLDKLKGAALEKQIHLFELHIRIAQQYNKPLIIHCVKAYNELIKLRTKYPENRWIIHGFRGKQQLALSLLQHNIQLSFGLALLCNKNLQTTFTQLPLATTFLETDEGASSEIYPLITCASQLKGLSLHDFNRQLLDNNTQIFKI
jgi:TatD DNase family protein